jgi:hypothetical protein
MFQSQRHEVLVALRRPEVTICVRAAFNVPSTAGKLLEPDATNLGNVWNLSAHDRLVECLMGRDNVLTMTESQAYKLTRSRVNAILGRDSGGQKATLATISR